MTSKMLATLAATAFCTTPAFAQDKSAGGGKVHVETPNVATEIVIEDLTLTVKKLRIGVALSPEQIERIGLALTAGSGSVNVTKEDETSQHSSGGSAADQ